MTAFLSIGTDTATLVAIVLGAVSVVLLVVLATVAGRMRQARRELRFLRGLADADDLEEVLSRVLEEARRATETSTVLVAAGDRAGEPTTLALGMTESEAEAHRFHHGRRVRSELGENDPEDPRARSLSVRYAPGEPGEGTLPIAAALAVPIRARGTPIGVIEVFSRSAGRRFSDAEHRALERLAARAAPVVESRLRASVDELTNLNDFDFFRQALAHQVAAAHRYDRRLGLLAFDLVGLGEINATPGLGPSAGDTVLRAVGGLAREAVRRSDIACRRGGDEFVVILPESGLDGADQVYRRLSHEIADLQVEYDGRVLSPVGVSAGAVELRRDDDADSLFDRADEALDRAKSWGRGRIAWGLGDRSEPPAEAAYGPGSKGHACSGCLEFRPGTRVSGYCERWHAPIDPRGACTAFEPRRS